MRKNVVEKAQGKIIYSGSHFKSFLKRNKISYKEAAETLGIDKNTVAKAVKGGNLNIDVILRICNVYQLKITDLFVKTDANGTPCNANYYNSTDNKTDTTQTVSEGNFNYKKCENFTEHIKVISEMINHSMGMLAELSAQYENCRQALNTLLIEEK